MVHAYVLFKPSDKKGKAKQRGRFAAGERTTLSLMERAVVQSTTRMVQFTERGRTKLPARRAAGSRVWDELKVTDEELEGMRRAVRSVLVPEKIALSFNGEVILYRPPRKTIEATLPTETDEAAAACVRLGARRPFTSIFRSTENRRLCTNRERSSGL